MLSVYRCNRYGSYHILDQVGCEILIKIDTSTYIWNSNLKIWPLENLENKGEIISKFIVLNWSKYICSTLKISGVKIWCNVFKYKFLDNYNEFERFKTSCMMYELYIIFPQIG